MTQHNNNNNHDHHHHHHHHHIRNNGAHLRWALVKQAFHVRVKRVVRLNSNGGHRERVNVIVWYSYRVCMWVGWRRENQQPTAPPPFPFDDTWQYQAVQVTDRQRISHLLRFCSRFGPLTQKWHRMCLIRGFDLDISSCRQGRGCVGFKSVCG